MIRKNLNNKRFLLGFIFLNLAAIVFFTSTTAGTGNAYYKLQNQVSDLQEENARLSEKIIHNESLTRLQDSAADQSFTKPTNVVFVRGLENLASR